MPRKPKRRRSHKIRETFLIVSAVCLIILTLAAFAGIYWLYWTADKPVKLRADNFCPLAGPTSIAVLLVDATDPLPEVASIQIEKYVSEFAPKVPKFGLLEIRLLDPKKSGGRTIFSRCNPGDGKGLDGIRDNPEMIKRRWMREYELPLADALRSIPEHDKEANQSPIMEAIQRIAVERFEGERNEKLERNLVVISDMLQHGETYSHYRNDLSFETFKKSSSYRKVRTDLHGASVEIQYLQRRIRRAIDSREHIKFWVDWIQDNNGVFVEARRLQGLG